jgi:hypothetical protein
MRAITLILVGAVIGIIIVLSQVERKADAALSRLDKLEAQIKAKPDSIVVNVTIPTW